MNTEKENTHKNIEKSLLKKSHETKKCLRSYYCHKRLNDSIDCFVGEKYP